MSSLTRRLASPRAIAVARLVAFGVALVGSAFLIGFEFTRSVPDPDYGAYRDAAFRILSGDALYPPADPDAGTTYRYAPWFAVAWIPFAAAGSWGVLAWKALIAVGAIGVSLKIARLKGHAALVLTALSLSQLSAVPLGNVEVLTVALLVWRRCDPWSVGIAASLKVYPILLVLGYVAERRWRDVVLAIGLAGALWLPAAFLGLGDYVTQPGGANGLAGGYLWDAGVWPFTTILLGSAAVYLAWRRSRWTTLVVAAAIPWLVPRYTASGLAYVFSVVPRLARTDRRSQ